MSDVDIAVLPAGETDKGERWGLRLDLGSRRPGVLGVSGVDVAVLPDVSVQLGFEVASQGIQVHGRGSRGADEALINALTDFWDYQHVFREARAAMGERMQAYAKG